MSTVPVYMLKCLRCFELEHTRAELARLKDSTFYRCDKCGATCMGEG